MWGDYVTDIPIFLFVFALLYKMKFYFSDNKFNNNYLSKDNTLIYKGILAFLVLFRHLNNISGDSFINKFTHPVSDIAVKMFFFFSGFGLVVSFFSSNNNHNISTLFNRIKRIVAPALIYSVFYFLIYLFNNSYYESNSFTVRTVFEQFFSKGYLFVYNSWFLLVLLIQYVLFYFIFEKLNVSLKNKNLLLFLSSTILTVMFYLLYKKLNWGVYWWISIYSFNIGVLWASYRESIENFFRKNYKYKLSSIIIFLVVSLAVQELLLKNSGNFYDIYKHMITSAFLIILILMLLMKVQFNSRVWMFFGEISYEIYLLQGFVYTILLKDVFGVKNNLIFEIVVIVILISISYICHYALNCKIKHSEYSKYLTVQNSALLIVFVFTVFSILSLFADNAYNLYSVVWNGQTVGIFPDLFESIIQSSTKHPYEQGAIYPAFTYLILYPFSLLLPGDYKSINDLNIISGSIQGFIFGSLFMMICFITFILLLSKLFNAKNIKNYLFILMVLMCAPVIFEFERGNVLILALIFLLIFIIYYESDNKIYQNIALISLAFAVNMKLIPAIFGILLIKKKDSRMIIKAVIYFLVVFVLSFIPFGGIGEIITMIDNIKMLNQSSVKSNFGYGFKVNSFNFLSDLFQYYSINNAENIAKIISVIIIVSLVVALLFAKKKWNIVLIASLVIIQIPNFSYLYNLLYLLIPLAMYISCNSNKKINLASLTLLIFFALSLCQFPYGNALSLDYGQIKMNIQTIFNSIGVIFLSLYSVIYSMMNYFKTNKKELKGI